MNSSVIVCDIILSLLRIIYKISINIVKNIYIQQLDGGVAECVMIVGTWLTPVLNFLFLFFSNK